MGITTREVPGRLEPSMVTWGRRHCRTWTMSAAPLTSEYVDLNQTDSAFAEVQKYYWFNLNSTGADPVIAGKTAVEIVLGASPSVADTLTAIKVAVDADANFKDASISGSVITIENNYIGPITAEADSIATGFTMDVAIIGLGGLLGDTSGGITFNMESTTAEITSDQKGSYIIDEVFTGAGLTMDMSLLDLSVARWASLVGGVIGDNFTPSGGTEVTGMGTDKLFKNMSTFAGELVLSPLSTASGDRSRDITFWLCAPIPSSVNFSGSDVQVMEVSFKAMFDQTKNTKVNMFVFGDSTQTGFDI